MKNTFLNKIDSIISIKITGKNVYNFINKIIKNKINIYNLDIINRKEAIVKIKYKDYLKLKKMHTIYHFSIYSYHGKLKIRNYIKKNYIFYTAIILGLILLFILSKMIFSIEVIHSNKDIRDLIYKELNYHGINTFTFKKDYHKLESIENKILSDNKDKLEWIEINISGTKYIVKVLERKLNNNNVDDNIYNVVASKNAIISKVKASHGVILKNTNDYVRKGEVIISSNVILPNGSVNLTNASGTVYGEVWYEVEATHPYIYKEESATGKKREIYVVKFLNKRFSIFDFNHFDTFKYNEKVILKDNYNIIRFVKEKQYELKVIDEYYTKEELINKMVDIAKNKISENLEDDEYIKNYFILEDTFNESGITLKIFFSVVESIGVLEKIENIVPNE